MSLIAVRAETAPYRLSGLSEPVRDEFGSLSGAARAALADMRRLLVVGLAATGADAVSQARQLKPDVILMDVRMPVLDGLQATRQILDAGPDSDRPGS